MIATRPASADEHDTHVAVSAIDHEIARLKRERETLLAPVRQQMEADGTTALHDPDTGKALFRLDDVTRDVLDEDGLVAEHPEVEILLVKHTVQKISRRFTVARPPSSGGRMSQVRMFDSWDDAIATMQADEDAANAALSPDQRALRDDADRTVYAIGVFQDGDVVVYYEVHAAKDAALRARGYLTGVGYSAWMPEGEHGDVHVSQVMAIGAATFALAREEGWPNTLTNPRDHIGLVHRLALDAATARSQ